MTKSATAKSFPLHVWSDASNRSYPEPAAQASVVQWAQKDPKTGNLDAFQNGASTSGPGFGTPIFGFSQAGYLASNTTNGNTLLCIATIATDAHNTPPNTGNQISSVQDTVNGAWDLLGSLDNITDCNCELKAYVKFNAAPLLGTSWTGTGSVASGDVLTIGSGTGAFRIGQRINSTHTPTPTATGGDVIVTAKLSGTLGAAGSTYQLGNGSLSLAPFASEAMTTTDVISMTFEQIFSFTDYPGMFLAELNGTDGSTAYFSGHNDAPTSAGTDTVTSGNLVMAASPGILFGFGFNGGVNNSNAFPPLYAPSPGTGFGTSHAILEFDQGNPICTVEWQHFSSLGTRAAKFSPTADSRYATVGVGFLDHA